MTAYASLTGIGLPGVGLDKKLGRATARHTMIVSVSGVASDCCVIMQGSHDGLTWTDIGEVKSTTGGLYITGSDGALVAWVRADLRRLIGQATVTATIASEDGL